MYNDRLFKFCQMVLSCSDLVFRITAGICLISNLVNAAAFSYTFSKIDISGLKVHLGNKLTKANAQINEDYFIAVGILVVGLLSIGMIIYEVFLLAKPLKFGFFKSAPTRSLIYICIGFSALGVACDLGIAAGVISVFAGSIILILWILTKIKCIILPETNKPSKDQYEETLVT